MPGDYLYLRSYAEADDAEGVKLVDEAAAREFAAEAPASLCTLTSQSRPINPRSLIRS